MSDSENIKANLADGMSLRRILEDDIRIVCFLFQNLLFYSTLRRLSTLR